MYNSNEAEQAFDGVMLGDGHLSRGQYGMFKLGQTGVQHKDWLLLVRSALEVLGVDCPPVKVYASKSCATREQSLLWSYSGSDWVTQQRKRWYPDGKKVVPNDLVFTAIMLAHWFMGDGSSSYIPGSGSVAIWFCTDGFDSASVDSLIVKLRLLRILHVTKCRHKKEGSFRLLVRAADQRRFMELVGPHVVPSYSYKIKWPDISRLKPWLWDHR